MKNYFYSLLVFFLASGALAQTYESGDYPVTEEENYYEGDQINQEVYPPEELSEIERQEEEINFSLDEDYVPHEEVDWENYEEPLEEY